MIFRSLVLRLLLACLLAGAVPTFCLAAPVPTSDRARSHALSLLRAAAEAGHVDAQLMLAHLLADGDALERQEAVRWYLAAGQAGSEIGKLRYSELSSQPWPARPPGSFFIQRPPSGSFDNPGDSATPTDVPPGYHCHDLGRGRLWCHGSGDGIP